MATILDEEDLADQSRSFLLNEESSSDKYGDKGYFGSLSGRWRLTLVGLGIVSLGLVAVGVSVGPFLSHQKEASDDFPVNVNKKEEKFPYLDIRLPDHVVPLKYRVYLHPNITNGKFDFSGHTRILIECKRETDFVILHNKGNKIKEAYLFEGDALDPQIEEDKQDKDLIPLKDGLISHKHEFLMLRLKEGKKLKPGEIYTIVVKYEGQLSIKTLDGFYRSSYKTSKGETR